MALLALAKQNCWDAALVGRILFMYIACNIPPYCTYEVPTVDRSSLELTVHLSTSIYVYMCTYLYKHHIHCID